MQEIKVMLKGLTCANCAGKIEKVLSEIEKTEEVSINLMKQELTMKYREGLLEEVLQKTISDTVHRFEPHVEVLFDKKEEVCDGGGCCCTSCGCHDHDHHHDHCSTSY